MKEYHIWRTRSGRFSKCLEEYKLPSLNQSKSGTDFRLTNVLEKCYCLRFEFPKKKNFEQKSGNIGAPFKSIVGAQEDPEILNNNDSTSLRLQEGPLPSIPNLNDVEGSIIPNIYGTFLINKPQFLWVDDPYIEPYLESSVTINYKEEADVIESESESETKVLYPVGFSTEELKRPNIFRERSFSFDTKFRASTSYIISLGLRKISNVLDVSIRGRSVQFRHLNQDNRGVSFVPNSDPDESITTPGFRDHKSIILLEDVEPIESQEDIEILVQSEPISTQQNISIGNGFNSPIKFLNNNVMWFESGLSLIHI